MSLPLSPYAASGQHSISWPERGFQSNPKLYDIDAALQDRRVVYWHVPQFFEQLKAGDHALIWRSGNQAASTRRLDTDL